MEWITYVETFFDGAVISFFAFAFFSMAITLWMIRKEIDSISSVADNLLMEMRGINRNVDEIKDVANAVERQNRMVR